MFGINDTNQNDNKQPTDSQTNNNPSAAFANSFADDTPPALASDNPSAPIVPNNTSSGTAPAATQVPQDELLGIKGQVLSSLAPLVGHLDQTPEEKFKTTMMLIQASDNASLIKDAYQAANQISDEKARAQALLDIVNEINYFTQSPSAGNKEA